ncbi:MAG: TolC family protein [Acidobacteria bacterium]|nr:TolC family protein [Acidobacteriota bacterium]
MIRIFIPFFLCSGALAQEISLPEAVRQATSKYPSVQISLDQVSEAAAGINLARLAYLPRAEMLGQVNRATANNVFGMLLPQTVVSPISGPLLPTGAGFSNVWGTAVGLMINWEPFDFGRRQAEVSSAASSKLRAEAGVARTQLEVATATADAYLTALAAQQSVLSAQAAVTRSRELVRLTEALVKSELRPGADLSRIQSEVLLAEAQVVRAEQSAATARASLAQFTGPAALKNSFTSLPPVAAPAGIAATHPHIREQQAAIDEIKARQAIIDKSWYPRINTQANVFGRGSGTNLNGPYPGGANGLGPTVGNWAVGATVTFPLLEYKTLRARRQLEDQRIGRESSRKALLERELAAALERAQVAVTGARSLALITPQQVTLLKQTLEQITARYRAGLANLTEVTDTQRLLTQTEIDDALAILNVWRTELALAATQGDLAPFLSKVP